MKRFKKTGSFTVEAALIMPAVTGIIVLFIYIAMFCHDRCMIEYICQKACLEAACDEQAESLAAAYAYDGFENRLIGHWDIKLNAYPEDNGIVLEAQAATGIFNRVLYYKTRAVKHFRPKY